MLDTVDASSMLHRLELEGNIQSNKGIYQISLALQLLSALRKMFMNFMKFTNVFIITLTSLKKVLQHLSLCC